jgi:hypothetical protein
MAPYILSFKSLQFDPLFPRVVSFFCWASKQLVFSPVPNKTKTEPGAAC